MRFKRSLCCQSYVYALTWPIHSPLKKYLIPLPSSSSWFGFGTSFRMLKISSLVALLLKATAKQRATECPGRESKHRMGGWKGGEGGREGIDQV